MNTANTTLTVLETAALTGWNTNAMSTKRCSLEDVANQKNDNATWHSVKDVAESCGTDMKGAGGVLTSLQTKGFVEYDGERLFNLTDAGIEKLGEIFRASAEIEAGAGL